MITLIGQSKTEGKLGIATTSKGSDSIADLPLANCTGTPTDGRLRKCIETMALLVYSIPLYIVRPKNFAHS